MKHYAYFVEEELRLFFADDFCEFGSNLVLAAGVT